MHRLDDVVEKIDSTDLKTTKSAPPPHRLDESGKWGKPELDEIIEKLHDGGVTEWPNVPVLKTGDLARGPRVQISPPPPTSLDKRETFSVSRRLSRCCARLVRARSPCLSLSKSTSRVLGGVSLSGPVAVPFDRG